MGCRLDKPFAEDHAEEQEVGDQIAKARVTKDCLGLALATGRDP
jgi:hypothetical protein